MKEYDIIILGAGVSGLMCAAVAKRHGKSIAIIDHAAKPGKKILVSGGGKCNFTNRSVSFEDYVGENPHFTRSALAGFSPEKLLELARQYRLWFEEREEGQLFCQHSAHDFLEILLQECVGSKVNLYFNETLLLPVTQIKGEFIVKTVKHVFKAKKLVIATGSAAWPQIGATDIGHKIAKAFGHKIIPLRPALVGLVMENDWQLTGLSGISHRVTLRHIPDSLSEKKRALKNIALNLPLLFTHKGVSGPAALQASLYWRRGDTLLCDFFPTTSVPALLANPTHNKLFVKNFIKQHMPTRLAEAIIPAPLQEKRVGNLSKKEKDFLNKILTSFTLFPQKTEGLSKAEVTAGGVSTEHVSSQTMESKVVPGLYFCGEVLDITGRLGGYNIHWALASGHLAGLNL